MPLWAQLAIAFYLLAIAALVEYARYPLNKREGWKKLAFHALLLTPAITIFFFLFGRFLIP